MRRTDSKRRTIRLVVQAGFKPAENSSDFVDKKIASNKINKYEESNYWKYRKGKEIRSFRDRKYVIAQGWDDVVLTINSSDFVNAYIKNITPVATSPRTYADVVKSGWVKQYAL